jgi:hypothetical protein
MPEIVHYPSGDVGTKGPKGDQGERGIPGGGGGGAALVREALAGARNGTNVVFTAAFSYLAESTVVYLNGLMQSETDDYVESNSVLGQITFVNPPQPGDKVLMVYSVGA